MYAHTNFQYKVNHQECKYIILVMLSEISDAYELCPYKEKGQSLINIASSILVKILEVLFFQKLHHHLYKIHLLPKIRATGCSET